jgi:hypothetical protein
MPRVGVDHHRRQPVPGGDDRGAGTGPFKASGPTRTSRGVTRSPRPETSSTHPGAPTSPGWSVRQDGSIRQGAEHEQIASPPMVLDVEHHGHCRANRFEHALPPHFS